MISGTSTGCSPTAATPGEPKFPHLAMIARAQTEVQRNGKIEHESRYSLSSAKLNAQTFARAVRDHWGIESVP